MENKPQCQHVACLDGNRIAVIFAVFDACSDSCQQLVELLQRRTNESAKISISSLFSRPLVCCERLYCCCRRVSTIVRIHANRLLLSATQLIDVQKHCSKL